MKKEKFTGRHIGPNSSEVKQMIERIGVSNTDELIDQTIPSAIRLSEALKLDKGISEFEYLKKIRKIAKKNRLFRTYIGMGYYDTMMPAVIQRNILENPAWYTSYTPYQAEISQGRLEALLNYQTMICELTGMEIANASLLDEATAAAEAMIMLFNSRTNIFPQTLAVLNTRANSLGIEIITGNFSTFEFDTTIFGSVVQYPAGDGSINDYTTFVQKAHETNVAVTAIADILSLAILTPPGAWGADVVVGSTQRFGIPMGYGGPHAAYFATKDEYKRNMPGRIIGVSKDAAGNHALRMALQTREQHIKREKATSNICTAQALLATMAGMYAVYHGADGLKRIATNVHSMAAALAKTLIKLGFKVTHKDYFDTLKIELPLHLNSKDVQRMAIANEMNFRYFDEQTIGISINETTTRKDLNKISKVLSVVLNSQKAKVSKPKFNLNFDEKFIRTTSFMGSDTFNRYQTETKMMRYIKKLERRDFSLTHSMISLGSCTMKLNAAIEMLPMSWAEFGGLHPYAPIHQAKGYQKMFKELEYDLKVITGFDGISLQPNSGAAGEYAGLAVIRKYHKKNGQANRDIVLIPASAHGTNPASAVMAGLKVVVVKCDEKGNVDMTDLKEKAEKHAANLSAFMITYPSTHGVFEPTIVEMCQIIHQNGGQVYMDGANMNAQVGYTNPATIGADVCHLNLHKTFAIPHGGGGPGVGPIGVAKHLTEFLPSHPVIKMGGEKGVEAVAAAPWGSASVLTISYAYIKLMGSEGLQKATKFAILNANYLAQSLKDHYNILYTGPNNRVGHEMILDCRPFKKANVDVVDIAKRLIDYGFHAPTVSFPVAGTLMVEPTESESKAELDRFVDALIAIRKEIDEIAEGKADANDNVLKNAPHTLFEIMKDDWAHPYSRQKAAFPLKWIEQNKFFPAVSRIDDAYGDRNLCCTTAPIDTYITNLFKELNMA